MISTLRDRTVFAFIFRTKLQRCPTPHKPCSTLVRPQAIGGFNDIQLDSKSMPILGIGVDLVHVPRIVSLISRRTPEKFAAKILSPQEYQQWQNIDATSPQRIRFLAVRYEPCTSFKSYANMFIDGVLKKRHTKPCILLSVLLGRKSRIAASGPQGKSRTSNITLFVLTFAENLVKSMYP